MAGPERASVEELSATAALSLRSGLVALLEDVVKGGASVGFLPPLDGEEAGAYWDGVAATLKGGSRRLWIACAADGGIVGTVQLDLPGQANGRHRAEVIKLMVLSGARRQGLGRLLMEAAEAEAHRLARKLELHYTPKHGSWLNMAEIEFSVLSRQCLKRRIADREILQHEVTAWVTARNSRGATIDWRFTTQDARIKLKRLYPCI